MKLNVNSLNISIKLIEHDRLDLKTRIKYALPTRNLLST